MFHPLRGTLLDLVLERAASINELAVALQRPPSTVAYHVGVLTDADLLRVVRTRRRRAVDERLYGRTARIFYVGAHRPRAAHPHPEPAHGGGRCISACPRGRRPPSDVAPRSDLARSGRRVLAARVRAGRRVLHVAAAGRLGVRLRRRPVSRPTIPRFPTPTPHRLPQMRSAKHRLSLGNDRGSPGFTASARTTVARRTGGRVRSGPRYGRGSRACGPGPRCPDAAVRAATA
jgi:DNA-binding transcriptional ArsR family regulator